VTYSRPGIRTSNVSPGQQLGNSLSIDLPEVRNRTPDAPYRDARNPRQAGENAKLKYKAIESLLEFAGSKSVREAVAAQIDASAKREAGKVLDAYPAINTTSTDNPEAIAALNGLSPRAKDFVVEAQAANAVSTYGLALEAEVASRPIITAAGDTPEQQELRAKALSEAKAAARDMSGLSGLPSYQIAQNSQQLASYDAVVQGNAYKKRLATQTDLALVGLQQGAGSELIKGWQGINKVASSTDQPVGSAFDVVIDGIIDTSANNVGPTGQARVLAGGIENALKSISDPTEQLQFLEALKDRAARGKVGADGKTDVFSVPLGRTGVSISDKLETLIPDAEGKADRAIVGKTYLEAVKLGQEGKVEQARDLMLSRAELLSDPSMIPTFISQMESLTTRVTPEMRQRGYEMFERQLNDEDAAALYKEMIAADVGTYSPQDVRSMFSLAQQGGGDGTYSKKRRSFTSAIADGSDVYDTGFASYLAETGLSQEDRTRVDGTRTVYTDAAKRARFNYRLEVQDKFFAKLDAAEPGKFDPLRALNEAINETVYEKKQAGGSNDGVASSPRDQYVGWAGSSLKALSQVAATNGNQIQGEQIPATAIAPATLQAWQQANPEKSFDSLTGLQKERLLVRSIQSYKKFDAAKQQYVNYTEQEAKQRVNSMLKEAERQAANGGGSDAARVPEVVPETPEELKDARRPRMQGYGREPIEKTLGLLEKAAQWSTTKQEDPFNFNKVFNNGGFGPQAMSYVDGFLNLTLGAAPANAGQLDFGTPEGLEALRSSWSSGQNGLNTAPLPQVATATPVRYVPVAINSDKHELFVMVGVAEGTRTASGGYTKAYYGHKDMGDGNWNRGTVSGGRGTSASPQMVDRRWMGTLTNVQQRMRGPLIAHGLQPGTAGFNRVMFNLIDLTVQSPAAARDFAGKLIEMKQKGWTVEAIAKARADSFINPATGRLDAPGFGNNYQRLFQDQRSRAGVYDYRRRI
jgi:hypothetical protein